MEAGVEFTIQIEGQSYGKLKAATKLHNAVTFSIQKLAANIVGHSYIWPIDIEVGLSSGSVVSVIRVVPPPIMTAEEMLPVIDAGIPQFLKDLERQLDLIPGIEEVKTGEIKVTLIDGPEVKMGPVKEPISTEERLKYLKPIGEGAYQSAEAVAQRTTDHRKHCGGNKWDDCFQKDGDYIDSYPDLTPEPSPTPKSSATRTLGTTSLVLGATTLQLVLR